MALNPFNLTSLQNYNTSPPPDDGTKVSSNETTWSFHIDKIGDPLKGYSDSNMATLNSSYESQSLWGETVAELTAATAGDIQGSLVATRGYFSANDGGGARYIFNSGSTASDDGGSVLIPDSAPTSGRWILINGGVVDARQFAAVGDGATNNTTALQNALNYLDSLASGTLIIPGGTFRTGNIDLTGMSNITITGTGTLKATDALADNLLDITTCTNIRITGGITIDHNSASSTAGNAVNIAGVTGLSMSDFTILNSKVAAIDLASGTNTGVDISDFTITNAVTGIDIGAGENVKIRNGTISTDVTTPIIDGGTGTLIESVAGAKTENFIASSAFVLSAGVKTIAVAHGLDFTPTASEAILTMQQDTSVNDFAVDFTRVVSTDGTDINAEVKIGTGSATTTATAKLTAYVKTKRG